MDYDCPFSVNDSFDTLTEPHRLLQSLNCFIGVLLPVLRPKYTCKPGLDPRLNVFPLISAILPGMDPNDAGKSLVIFYGFLKKIWISYQSYYR